MFCLLRILSVFICKLFFLFLFSFPFKGKPISLFLLKIPNSFLVTHFILFASFLFITKTCHAVFVVFSVSVNVSLDYPVIVPVPLSVVYPVTALFLLMFLWIILSIYLPVTVSVQCSCFCCFICYVRVRVLS